MKSIKPRSKKVRDRYWVVNRWAGKNGLRTVWFEASSWEMAMFEAWRCVMETCDLNGDCPEEWIVFVGSKGAVERRYKR